MKISTIIRKNKFVITFVLGAGMLFFHRFKSAFLDGLAFPLSQLLSSLFTSHTMKHLLLTLIVLSFFQTIHAQHHSAQTDADKPSTHGMLLFGQNRIYASHLPLFHLPHHYQILLELKLDDAAKEAFMKAQKENPGMATFTLEPERFVLPDMIANPRAFKATIYLGHFERGGQKLVDASVTIARVIYMKKLVPDAAKDQTSDFILFGDNQEQYIAHRLSNKPDFEQIIRVYYKATTNNELLEASVITLSSQNSPVGVSGNMVQGKIGQQTIELVLAKQIYLEFDDMK